LDGVVPRAEVFRWVDDSYNLVVAALPKATRATLQNPLTNNEYPS
jgi:predicted DNA-binding protein (MmcQ/YjbR family)